MYQLIIKRKAKKFIDKLPKNEKNRVVSAIFKKRLIVLADMESTIPAFMTASVSRLRVQWLA